MTILAEYLLSSYSRKITHYRYGTYSKCIYYRYRYRYMYIFLFFYCLLLISYYWV